MGQRLRAVILAGAIGVLGWAELGQCVDPPTAGTEIAREGLLERWRRRREERAEEKQQESTTVTTDKEYFLEHDGRKRRYEVHVPPSYDEKRPIPVVLNFHGGMGNADSQRRQSQMNPVADRYGFLVVYPDGTGPFSHRMLTYNAVTCCGYAEKNKVDDVGFVSALIDELPRHYTVDLNRVYATGFSNGAMLTHLLGCRLSNKLAAIGPVSGDLGTFDCPSGRPLPVIHFHGLQDQNSPFNGGVGSNQFQPNPHRSIPDTIQFWVKRNHCRPDPVVREERDYTITRYEPESGERGAPVVLYTFPEGGHTWPGGQDISAHLHTGKMITTLSAGETMWKFFEQFSLRGR